MFNGFDNLNNYDALKEAVNAPANPVKFLGIDPGKSNGICGYDAKCYLSFMTVVQATDMIKFLHCFEEVDTCVVEDYKLYPNKTREQVYSDMETSRVIGRIEHWAELGDVTLVKQGASIKPTGYAWIGKKPPPKGSPLIHQMDAHVHFTYWAIKNKKMDAATLLKSGVPNTNES